MTKFMKYKFTSGSEPSAAYCSQNVSNKAIFNCLFLYPSGVPNAVFVITLSYAKDGFSGYLDVPVDTSISPLSSRSLS